MVKVTNNSGRVIGGMVDNISYTFQPGEITFDGPLAQFKRVVDVLNTENGSTLKAE